MKRKEVSQLLEQLGSIGIKELYLNLSCDTHRQKKKLWRIIHDFEDMGMIRYNKKTETLRWIQSEEKPTPKGERLDKALKKEIPHGKRKKLATQDLIDIIDKHEIRETFPHSAMLQAENVSSEIPQNEIKHRLDLRKEFIVTIDGEDAKDLDDAVSIERKGNGYILGVHIADVSYYVDKDSPLDKEALMRGNSFYFINRVVPMFPKILSNGICSLNPQEDRLTLSAIMELNAIGEVTHYQIAPSVIHTSYRLTYEGVESLLEGKTETQDALLLEKLKLMHELFRKLFEKRIANGGIDFDFMEQKCKLDEDDEPVKLWLKKRIDSERIIEEFMLIANQTVAKYLSEKGISLYRIHEEPDTTKMDNFIRVALKFGHKITGLPMPETRELQKILREVKDKPHKELMNQVLLRSMQQAKYHIKNVGHYGLGFEFYTHFTSPIRRFADLIIHRLIKHSLTKLHDKALYSKEALDEIATHISRTERVAMEAERDYYKIKAIRFMENKVGQSFLGIITGVSSFGIFAQIKIFGVEGLIRYQDLDDDYYIFDEANYCANGKKSKKTYTVGDNIRLKVKKANVEKGFLDLVIDTGEKDFKLAKKEILF